MLFRSPLPQLLINGERKSRRQSSVGSGPHNFVIIDREEASGFEATGAEAAVPKEGVNTRANTLAISEGEGALGREATWDEYDPLSTPRLPHFTALCYALQRCLLVKVISLIS